MSNPLQDVPELVARLRKRADDEREIQRNNEAVADALQGQIDAFNRKDGSHNNFATRLGLEHRNCAKKDAALAKDWDDAADALEAFASQTVSKPSVAVTEEIQAEHPLQRVADALNDYYESYPKSSGVSDSTTIPVPEITREMVRDATKKFDAERNMRLALHVALRGVDPSNLSANVVKAAHEAHSSAMNRIRMFPEAPRSMMPSPMRNALEAALKAIAAEEGNKP